MEDLLALWGEEKVQKALVMSHCNMDQLEAIAAEIQKHGHSRMALEYRSKTK